MKNGWFHIDWAKKGKKKIKEYSVDCVEDSHTFKWVDNGAYNSKSHDWNELKVKKFSASE